MTPESLNKAARRYQTVVALASVPFIPLMIFSISIAKWLANSLSSFGIQLAWQTLNLALIAIWIAALVGAMLAVQRRIWPNCPNCHKRITLNTIPIVIASKHCPMCGALIMSQES